MGKQMARILLADDEETFRDLLRMILTGEGHTCEAVSDGEAAITCLKEQPYDVFLCDLVMGELNGIETIALARDLCPKLKVIAVSGASGYARQAGTNIPIGAHAMVPKPFKIQELTGAITQMLAPEQVA